MFDTCLLFEKLRKSIHQHSMCTGSTLHSKHWCMVESYWEGENSKCSHINPRFLYRHRYDMAMVDTILIISTFSCISQMKQHEPRLKGGCSVLSEECCWMLPLATNYHVSLSPPLIPLCVIQFKTFGCSAASNKHTYTQIIHL